jgi:hypothetical protein
MRYTLVPACLLFSFSAGAQEVDSAVYLPAVLASGERVIVTGAMCRAAEAAGALAQPCLAETAPSTIRGNVERLAGDALVIAGSSQRLSIVLITNSPAPICHWTRTRRFLAPSRRSATAPS